MTLKELQNMIKEEFDAYMGEAEDDVDVSVSDNDIDAEMGDMGDMGDGIDETEEDVLRKIFDMLKTHFEGDEDGEDMEDMDDAEGEEEADLEELANHGVGKPAGKTTGVNAGYKTVSESKKAKNSKIIAEAHMKARFAKLANIKK